jgi:hypothetical protein
MKEYEKFKVGDKVRRLKNEFGKMKPGNIGTIKSIENKIDIKLIEFDGEHDVRNFELVQSSEPVYEIY